MSNIYFPICAVLISFLITLIYYMKRRIKNTETNLYGILLIVNLFESLIAVIILSLAILYGKPPVIQILNRIDFMLILYWVSLLFKYICFITIGKEKKWVQHFSIIFNITSFLLINFTTMELINENGIMDTKGLSPTILYISVAIYLILIFIILAKSFSKEKKNITNKKYVPLYSLMILAIIMMIVRQIKPDLTLVSFIITYVNLIMFFTIENPDVKMIERLELARNQADKANKAKTEFLSSMSHEIRTPLNAIVGFSECLVENKNLEDEVKGYAKDIVDASNNLLEIVNGILDISKIEANKMEIIPKDYNPKEIFSSLEKLILPRIADKPIEFKTYIADDLPGVLNGDVSKLKQIIINILTNAAKYTDKGQIIYSISCINKIEKKKCSLFISVKDTGRGIKKESINKLFNKFERIDEDKNTTIEGTGLGLAITKRLVEMMGGKINVFSKYGEGSNFTVYIEQDIIDMNPPKEEKIETQMNYNIYNGKKVLIVDDSTINLKVATQILKPYNFEITTAISGFEAIEKVNNQNFDLILMDIMMPKMNGVETLKKLKEKETFMIPVIALTADAIEGMDAKYISEGFNDYLSKPINKDELNRVINKYIIGGK